MQDNKKCQTANSPEGEYYFGDIKEYNLEKIEAEVLNESIYLDVFAGSDLRFKKNITPISESLNLIKGLEGVTYNYRADDYPQYKFSSEKQIGFIAQEVEKIVPEVVQTDANGYLGIDYSKFAPLLVEGIKELEKRLEAIERENKMLRERINALQKPSRKNKEIVS